MEVSGLCVVTSLHNALNFSKAFDRIPHAIFITLVKHELDRTTFK